MNEGHFEIGGQILVHANSRGCLFQCAKCSLIFQSGANYKSHVFAAHFDQMNTISRLRSLPLPDFTRPPPSLQQSIASSVFLQKSRIKIAPKISSGSGEKNSIVRCRDCRDEKIFKSTQGLWSHQRYRHPKIYKRQCEKCLRSFKHYDELKKHRGKTHAHQNNKIKCDFCEKMLQTEFERDNHVKKEHSGRRYQCQFCTYHTEKAKKWKQHIKTAHSDQSQPITGRTTQI